MKITRRMLLGGLAVGAGGAAIGLKPSDMGGHHSDYFVALGNALDQNRIATPTLVIDKQKMLRNVATLRGNIQKNSGYRIVAKSLPSLPLLQAIMEAARTNKLMLFHQPFLNQVMANLPNADVLMGKPMPIEAAHNFYREYKGTTQDSKSRLQWLIDSPDRLRQYQQLASELSMPMRINIEIDVGLHRGGVSDPGDVVLMLKAIDESKWLSFSGFMGYEPHVAKVPGSKIDARDKAMKRYQMFRHTAEQFLQRSIDDLVLNCGGSPTYQFYKEGTYPHNELSAGSCLVKATDFDIPSLEDHQPACYIATPVLKALEGNKIPSAESLEGIMSWWNPNRQRTFFTYGGFWKARVVSPPGLINNPLMGRSTNQEMYNGSASVNLAPDDFVFFRPTQSEFVFLQFGDIAVYDHGEITDWWPILGCSKQRSLVTV